MGDRNPASYDSARSSPTLYLKDPASAYDVSRYDADRADEVCDDDDSPTTTLNAQKRRSTLEGFPVGLQRHPWVGVRVRMAAFLALAALCIFVHHNFYTFLNGRSVNDGPLSVFREQLHAGLGEQTLAITIGNALAAVAKACLSGAVVTAFEQLFWWRLKKGASSLKQVDTMLAFRSNPLDPTSATAWLSFPFLSAIAFLAAAFVAIPIAAPGALTVNPAAQRMAPCTVSTVDLTRTQFWTLRYSPVLDDDSDGTLSPLIRLHPATIMPRLVSYVLMAGNYLPPRTPGLSDLVAYNISFPSLVMACDNITGSLSDKEMMSYLPYILAREGTVAVVWNATYLPHDKDYGLHLVVAARSLDMRIARDWTDMDAIQYDTELGPRVGAEVVRCTPRNATYDVTVQPGTAGSDARVLIRTVTPLPRIQRPRDWAGEVEMQYYAVYDAFARALNGSVTTATARNTTDFWGNILVASSALALGSMPGGNVWVWRTDLLHALPSLMRNISLSLLSGRQLTANNQTTLTDVATTCVFSGVRFQYNRARLLGTYLVAGVCALGAVLLAFIVVGRNGGVGESFAFSRMVGAGIDLRERLADLHGAEGEVDVTLKTRVRLEDKPYGSLVPQ